MNTKRWKVGVVVAGSVALGTWAAPAQHQTNMAPQAERVLSAACQYLAEAPYFGLGAEVWREHVTASGQKLLFSRTVSMEVKGTSPKPARAAVKSPRH